MAKNYLDHEIKVKFTDMIIKRKNDFQWFIEIVEKDFEINEIIFWKEFLMQRSEIETVFSYFIKIVKLDQLNIDFKNPMFKELYYIAEYYENKIELVEIQKLISFSTTKLFCLIIWITKIENSSNYSDYIYDYRLLTTRNAFKVVDVSNLIIYEDNILNYFEEIGFEEKKEVIEVFLNNLHQVNYEANHSILDKYKQSIINVNCFNYGTLKIEEKTLTNEEDLLFSMLKVKFKGENILPAVTYTDGTCYPDYTEWSEELLNGLIDYFNHDVARFVIESVRYFIYKIPISKKVFVLHVNLFLARLSISTSIYEKFGNSSFALILNVMKDKKNKYDKKSLMLEVGKISNIEEIKYLSNVNFPLNREQKEILKSYNSSVYKRIDEVNEMFELTKYFRDKYISMNINNEYFQKVAIKFNEITYNKYDVSISVLFIEYMKFLFRCSNVNKQLLNFEMIRIQKLWETQYYEKSLNNMQVFSRHMQINHDDVIAINEYIMSDILQLATHCMLTKENEYVQIMEVVSQCGIKYMTKTVKVYRKFPVEELVDEEDVRDIDELYFEIVNRIIETQGYKFLNIFENSIYIKAIVERIEENTRLVFSLFNKECELYEDIKSKLSNEIVLIDYDKNLTIAHITQLFPVLENKIKELGILMNIFPYKEHRKKFMENKDPSSILRLLLKEIFDETMSFEICPDILFVYNCMYNGNTFNIRNECIHGRDYLTGDSLKFAFSVTVACVSMLIFRIDVIENNLANQKKSEEEIYGD